MIKKQEELPKILDGTSFKQSRIQWDQQESIEGVGKMYSYCLRCGKKLKDVQSRLLGYGPICYEKVCKEQHGTKLF